MRDVLAGKPKIELLMCDVDGVLTDGGMYFGPDGQVMKRFNVKDGQGMTRLRDSGVKIAFITADSSPIGQVRGERLRVTEVHVGCKDKIAVAEDLMKRHGVNPEAAIYVGDDLPDLCMIGHVGIFVAPADAVDEVREKADYITENGGGHGAVREVCDAIWAHNRRLADG